MLCLSALDGNNGARTAASQLGAGIAARVWMGMKWLTYKNNASNILECYSFTLLFWILSLSTPSSSVYTNNNIYKPITLAFALDMLSLM